MEKKRDYGYRIVVPLPEDLKIRLKKISEQEHLSMNTLIRMGVKNILKKYEKND